MALPALLAFALAGALAKTSQAAFVGQVFGVTLNGTTNQQQFFAADLETFIVTPFGSLGEDIDVLGGAAVVEPTTSLFWVCLYRFGPQSLAAGYRPSPASQRRHLPFESDDEIILAGLNISDGTIVQQYNTSAWTGTYLPILGIFLLPGSAGGLFLVASDIKNQGHQVMLSLDTVTGAAQVLGTINMTGGDLAWDSEGGLLYEVETDGSDDDSGSLYVIDTTAVPPVVKASFPLQNFFELPHWDSVTQSLMGLTLGHSPTGDYERNFTLLYPEQDSFNTSVRGMLGSFYALYDGPKAFDSVGRRAFYVIATSPMGEMDLVTVDVDSDPAVILESPGICGFIGYCPGAIAYFNVNSSSGAGLLAAP